MRACCNDAMLNAGAEEAREQPVERPEEREELHPGKLEQLGGRGTVVDVRRRHAHRKLRLGHEEWSRFWVLKKWLFGRGC